MLRVAGTIRVSQEITIFELPYAKGLDPSKLDKKMPDRSKEVLSDLIKDNGGRQIRFEDDHLRFEVPEERVHFLEADLKDWSELDKSSKLFQMPRMLQYPKMEVKKPSDTKRRPGGDDVTSESNRKKAPKSKERGVRDERTQTPVKSSGGGTAPTEKTEGKSFRVEIPVSMRGLVRRLQGNPHLKTVLEEYGGKPGKGEGLVMEFPDRKKRSEILDEISDAVQSSGFLREILDLAEI
jgi:hypothetical protein